MKSAASINNFKYPKSTDCKAVYSLYGVDSTDPAKPVTNASKKQFLKFATLDKP
jgi:hypothetical protein